MKGIGDLLRELRGKRTLREVSKLTGISHSFISACEKGLNPNHTTFIPSPDVLLKLSKVYNYSYIDLMIIAGYIPKTIQQSVDLLEKENVLTIGDRVLSEDEKARILQMIRLMFPNE